MNEVKLSIDEIIADALNISKDLVSDDLSYQSIIEWDSFSHINLILALEKEYDIVIDEKKILDLISILEIKKYISEIYIENDLKNNNEIKNKIIENKKLNDSNINRGLNGVFYDNTYITSIDGEAGKLLYCGYSIGDLVRFSNFEETTYLLLNKKLPTSFELKQFKEELKSHYCLPKEIIGIISVMKNTHPIDALRTAISALSLFKPRADLTDAENILQVGIQLIAQIPIIIAAHHAIRRGKKPIEPLKDLSHGANFLYMLLGEIPSEAQIRAFDSDLILHADHGSNASTFTARVVTGTKADIYAAVSAAISAFSGSLHGGALEEIEKMLKEIGTAKMVHEYIQKRLAKNLPIFGFGHRVYRTEDPRAIYLRENAKALSIEKGETELFEIAERVRKEMEPYAKRGIDVNVDFYGAVIYSLLGIPADIFTPTFVVSRVAGWVAQILEQSSCNILIRPRLNYIGASERAYSDADRVLS